MKSSGRWSRRTCRGVANGAGAEVRLKLRKAVALPLFRLGPLPESREVFSRDPVVGTGRTSHAGLAGGCRKLKVEIHLEVSYLLTLDRGPAAVLHDKVQGGHKGPPLRPTS
jgi:hypothetical protein